MLFAGSMLSDLSGGDGAFKSPMRSNQSPLFQAYSLVDPGLDSMSWPCSDARCLQVGNGCGEGRRLPFPFHALLTWHTSLPNAHSCN